LRDNLPLLQRELLLDLLQGHTMSAEALSSRLSQLALPFEQNDSVSLMLIRLEEPFIHYEYRDRILLEYAVKNIAEEVLRDHCKTWICKETHGYLAFIIKPVNETADGRAGRKNDGIGLK